MVDKKQITQKIAYPLFYVKHEVFLFLFIFSQKHNVLSYKSLIFAMSTLIKSLQ